MSVPFIILYTTLSPSPSSILNFLSLSISSCPFEKLLFALHSMLICNRSPPAHLPTHPLTHSRSFSLYPLLTHTCSFTLPHKNSLLFACSPIHIPYPFNPFRTSVEAVGGNACDIFLTELSPLKYSLAVLSWPNQARVDP